ncbi:hypothetical protein BASA60_002124 [Batrachochytrium salamandrivorans]|nr:hypothetical protein BASA60_002124 [Batrachochytrium salamandrivorans]
MAFKIDSRSLLHHQHRPQSQQHNQNRQPSFLNSPSQRQLQLDISPVLPVVMVSPQSFVSISLLATADQIINALQSSTPE